MKLTLTLATLLLLACSDAAAEAGADANAGAEANAEAAGSVAASPGTLALRMTGFRSGAGQALIAVFRGDDGFPGEPNKAWKQVVAKISGGRASVDLRDVPPGEYAVSVLHDENGNNQLDTNWIGMPKEGVGMSNNAKGRMGPPKYRDARFELGAAGAVQDIKMVYL